MGTNLGYTLRALALRERDIIAYNVAVDVGGTFTDVLVFDEGTGELTEAKVLSTTEDPSRGVVTGIE